MSVLPDFCVYKGQIPASLIDELLAQHEKFKGSSLSVFRAQGTTRFERPIVDGQGHQLNSIQNPHLLGFSPEFVRTIRKIIFHENVSKCLSQFTGKTRHVNYQSMLFDKSTGTKLHQDTWYLDTDPAGSLVGVWIALEDIRPEAGPFCVYSDTAQKRIEPTELDFDNLESDCRFRSGFPSAKRFDFLADKGDILIWRSFAIHGAHLPQNESFTRKSLTAHFYPVGAKVQDAPISRMFSIYDHDRPIRTDTPAILQAATISPVIYNAMCFALHAIGGVSRKLTGDDTANTDLSEIRRIDEAV